MSTRAYVTNIKDKQKILRVTFTITILSIQLGTVLHLKFSITNINQVTWINKVKSIWIGNVFGPSHPFITCLFDLDSSHMSSLLLISKCQVMKVKLGHIGHSVLSMAPSWARCSVKSIASNFEKLHLYPRDVVLFLLQGPIFLSH